MKILSRTFYTNILPVILFICMVIVDNINGYLQEFVVDVPISLLCRGGILIVTFPFLFRHSRNTIALLFRLLILIYLLAIPIWLLSAQYVVLSEELNYLFKFIYFFSIFFYFYYYRDSISVEKILNLIVTSAFLIAVLNILCYTFDIGVKSYGDTFGFGTKAFYVDGNTLGLYMVLSNCMSVWYAFYKRGKWLFVSVVITCGTMLIGSRTAILGSMIIWVMIVLFILFKSKRDIIYLPWPTRIGLCVIIGGVIISSVFALIQYIANYDAYTQTKFAVESVVSPREQLIDAGKKEISNFNAVECIIGKSRSGALYEMGASYLSVGEKKSIEADFHDMIMCFGWGFGGLMIVIQLMIALKIIRTFLCASSSLSFSLCLFAVLWIGASYMAGHGFNNTMLAPLIGATFMISVKIINVSRNGKMAL